MALAGLAWLLGGHPAANDFSRPAFGLNSGNATFYGLVTTNMIGAFAAAILVWAAVSGAAWWLRRRLRITPHATQAER